MRDLVRCFIFAAVSVLMLPLHALCDSSQVTIAISAPLSPVNLHSQIVVQVVMTNSTDKNIVVNKSVGGAHPELYYEIEASKENGRPVRLTKYGRDVLARNFVPVSRIQKTLKPNETLEESAVVSDLFDMSLPGKYTIKFKRSDPLNSHVKLISNAVEIQVAKIK